MCLLADAPSGPGVFVCVTFGYVPDLDAAAKLWTVLSDENSEPSVERLLTVYKQATVSILTHYRCTEDPRALRRVV